MRSWAKPFEFIDEAMTANSVPPAMRQHETASRIEVCRSYARCRYGRALLRNG
jgi:hypothetical protein